jgi:PAS domain S-box-containing protein
MAYICAGAAMRSVSEREMDEINQYQIAIEQSNIVSKTDIRGIITFVNDEFCRISGYTREELIGKNHNVVRHPDVPKANFKLLWDTILQKKTFKTTARNLAKDGTTFYVNTTITPILDKEGNILEFIAIRYDVTNTIMLTEQLRKNEEELESLNSTLEERVKEQTAQLMELNKTLEERIHIEVEKNREKDKVVFQQARLAAMGEMIGNIAHQWRQPLSELGIVLYNLKKQGIRGDEGEMLKAYEHGKSVIARMSKTIEDFRNFFNPAKRKEDFLVADVVGEVLSILEGSLSRHSVKTHVKINPNLDAYGYKNELSQVLMNIINNAKDALKSNNQPDNRNIYISASKQKHHIFIKISDNAGGVAEDIMEKIFVPYFTTKHQSSGTGLGLYIVKSIIEKSMEGEVSVENLRDGAQFTLKIPIK